MAINGKTYENILKIKIDILPKFFFKKYDPAKYNLAF